MANTVEEEGDMEVNSPPQQTAEMQDTGTSSPAIVSIPDNTPCQVDKYIDFLAINKHGHLLMGSSSLTGRYWGGSIWYYNDPALAPDVEKCRAGFETTSGVADGIFMDLDKVIVVGEDCGAVEFLSVCEDGELCGIRSQCRVDEHLDAVHSVKLTALGNSVLTGSADMSIRMWDCKTCLVVRMLVPAHSQMVTSLSPHPTNEQLFLSCGMDGSVLLWDLRCQKPASCVYRDYSVKPECVSWLAGGGDKQYLVGLQSGEVSLRSTDNFNHSLSSLQALPRPLYRIAVNPTRSTQFAVCGNDSRVIVADAVEGSLRLRYEDDRHKDFVRGLAWQDADTLVSCGWDTKVLTHKL